MYTSNPPRARRKEIAEETLEAIERGSYTRKNEIYALPSSVETTQFYNASDLSIWSSVPRHLRVHHSDTRMAVLPLTTLDAARMLSFPDPRNFKRPTWVGLPDPSISKVGLLNFASAKKPGGGFLGGAQAQEETIARSSTLYPSLTSDVAKEFYASHNKDPRGGYYSHAMIFSPDVTVFRNDDGYFTKPSTVAVVTSPAVNSGVVRRNATEETLAEEEKRIERVMRERMGRILFLFENRGISQVVLGSFGTGVFQNSVKMVAEIWAELLSVPGARFAASFETVLFGVVGVDTFEEFRRAYDAKCKEAGCAPPIV